MTATATMLSDRHHTVEVTDALGYGIGIANVLPAQNCCTCENPPVPTCPAPVDLGCNPDLDQWVFLWYWPTAVIWTGRHLGVRNDRQYGLYGYRDLARRWRPVVEDVCTYTLLRTYRATNNCGGMFAECIQEFSWTVFDQTLP